LDNFRSYDDIIFSCLKHAYFRPVLQFVNYLVM